MTCPFLDSQLTRNQRIQVGKHTLALPIYVENAKISVYVETPPLFNIFFIRVHTQTEGRTNKKMLSDTLFNLIQFIQDLFNEVHTRNITKFHQAIPS